MGNLFGLIEEKKCTACGVVKPKAMFGVVKRTARPGRIGYESKCRECKRAYDVERGKSEERKRDLHTASKKRLGKKAILKADVVKRQGILDAYVGAMCKVAWCRCSKCSTVSYYKPNRLHKALLSLESSMCKGCYRSAMFTGKTMQTKALKCVDCGCDTVGTKAKRRCDACAIKKKIRLKRISRKERGLRDNSIIKRVRKYGVVAKAVNRVMVYDRDGWACYVCGVQVVRSKTYRPDQATLDHIVPLSLGGPHTYGNVMTCCHSCNVKKSNKMPGGGVNL